MVINLIQFFIYSVVLYVLLLNMSLIFLIEPKFIAKYFVHKKFYQENRQWIQTTSLILLFLGSFALGMGALLMKLFNQLIL
jgi:hypothetical protein